MSNYKKNVLKYISYQIYYNRICINTNNIVR